MKKMLITMICALTLIASFVGCQVYDSQTNANLYHNGKKLQEFVADMEDACKNLKANPTDEASYNTIMDGLFSFDEHFWRKAMVSVKANVAAKQNTDIAAITETNPEKKLQMEEDIKENYNKKLDDVDWCKQLYKDEWMPIAAVATQITAYLATPEAEIADMPILVNSDGDITSLATLWEKTYKLRWDYNSKK